ncbi:hypothetical protein D1007_12209 [Hordeum vulgare]|nr:hypothetical protein D1007_12209 [Hordeum vulgare]
MRTLHGVLMHLEGGNEPSLEYPPSSSLRRNRSLCLPRCMTTTSPSSFSAATPAVAIKPEPEETPLGRRSRDINLVINEGHR